MFNQIQFGKRLQLLRNIKGVSQKEAAECLHISNAHLSKIEIGNGAPSIDLCVELSLFYGVTMDYLILGVQDVQLSPRQKIYEVIEVLTALEQQLP